MIAKWRVYLLGRLNEEIDYGFVIADTKSLEFADGRRGSTALDVFERWNPEVEAWERVKFYKDWSGPRSDKLR